MKAVKIAWNRFCNTPVSKNLESVVDQPQLSEFGHGDLLVYLPRHGWLVRRNYRAHWYVDMGISRKASDGAYGWTDLWLDVIAPYRAESYHLLDVDEFAAALSERRVSLELAAYALKNSHQLTVIMEAGGFPIPEVLRAETFAIELACTPRKDSPLP